MRALRRSLVFLVVLGALLVGADRLAVHLVEDEAAQRIKNARGMKGVQDASVDIKGFPFLTQAAGRNLDDVEARLSGMRAESGDSGLTVTRVDAHLRDVRIGEDYSSAVADHATGTALLSYKDLTEAAPGGVQVSWGGEGDKGRGRVKVTAGVSVLGQRFEKSLTSTVSLAGDRVRLHADDVPGEGIPGVEQAVRSKTDFARSISGLPKGLELDKVEANRKGIELTVQGSDVALTG